MQNEKDARALWQFCFHAHAQLLYYLKRADSTVNLEQDATQEVRALADNAIFILCAEGIIYASARKEQHERGVNSQWALGRRS
jgi:hypothetical protein